MEIILRINELIAEKGMNISQFADAAGLAYKTAHELVKGNSAQVRLKTMGMVCDALDCAPGDLFKVAK